MASDHFLMHLSASWSHVPNAGGRLWRERNLVLERIVDLGQIGGNRGLLLTRGLTVEAGETEGPERTGEGPLRKRGTGGRG